MVSKQWTGKQWWLKYVADIPKTSYKEVLYFPLWWRNAAHEFFSGSLAEMFHNILYGGKIRLSVWIIRWICNWTTRNDSNQKMNTNLKRFLVAIHRSLLCVLLTPFHHCFWWSYGRSIHKAQRQQKSKETMGTVDYRLRIQTLLNNEL